MGRLTVIALNVAQSSRNWRLLRPRVCGANGAKQRHRQDDIELKRDTGDRQASNKLFQGPLSIRFLHKSPKRNIVDPEAEPETRNNPGTLAFVALCLRRDGDAQPGLGLNKQGEDVKKFARQLGEKVQFGICSESGAKAMAKVNVEPCCRVEYCC